MAGFEVQHMLLVITELLEFYMVIFWHILSVIYQMMSSYLILVQSLLHFYVTFFSLTLLPQLHWTCV